MSADGFILNYYRSIPPVSRAIFTMSIGITLLTYLNVISPFSLIYSKEYVKDLQFWRVLTTFFYWGPATVDVIIHQVFMLRYSIMLEEAFGNTTEYLEMIFSGMGLIFVMGNILSMTRMSSSLSTFITYVWTKKNPMIIMQFLGFISIPAYYIPYVMCLFSLLAEKRIPKSDFVGIVAGHTYFYFKNVYPRTQKRSTRVSRG